MLRVLFRFIRNIFKGSGRKSGYSIKGFWGQIKHYNKDGVQIGYTVRGFWGQRKRYDMNGKLISYTVKNFWGGYNTYDADGNLISRSYKNIFGGYNTYDRYGNKKRVSRKGFFDVMLHFDVENPDPYESITVERRASRAKTTATVSHTVKNNPVQSTGSNVQPAEAPRSPKVSEPSPVSPVKKEKFSESRPAVSEHIGVEVESYSKDVSLKGQQPDASVTYCKNIEEHLKDTAITQYAKLLVFKFGRLEEFPAIAYLHGNMVVVEPLLSGATPFEFAPSEIDKARKVHVTGIDMSILDNEFYTLSMSGLGKEFEDLLPEYPFGNDGIYRTQYVFECGLVITEKSMEELRGKLEYQPT